MTAISHLPVIPRSILDTDLNKFTMQQAVLHHYPDVQSKYRFSNRYTNVQFSYQCFEKFRGSVARFVDLSLKAPERQWLEYACPWFSYEYLDYLSSFCFKSEQVSITFVPETEDPLRGQIEIEIDGPWVECILWEVPLMALLNEIYFLVDNVDWDNDGQEDTAFLKGKALFEAGCSLIDFGTRRRRSFKTQELVIRGLIRASDRLTNHRGGLKGTSNVYLAYKHNLTPVVTVAHEWFMGVGAIEGYEHVNHTALRLWEEVYPDTPSLLVALTDTFSSQVFLNEMSLHPGRIGRWAGLQQDSGNPLLFAPRVKEAYQKLGMDHHKRTLIYSDSLNTEKALRIRRQCDELGFEQVSFAIGTFLTNDFRTRSSELREISEALIIVIKLRSVAGIPCVKLSDDPTKYSGDEDTVIHVKRELGLE